MASKKSAKRGARKGAKQAKRKTSAKKAAKRMPARRATPKRAAAKRAAPKRAARPAAAKPSGPPPIRHGVITHTELASGDPAATQAWCESVLGWTFAEAMPTPAGPYRMWRFANETGGGIRSNNPPEQPGTIPYCEVRSIQETYAKAISDGATEMLSPQELPGGMGWIAIVSAPGGVPIGFWAMK